MPIVIDSAMAEKLRYKKKMNKGSREKCGLENRSGHTHMNLQCIIEWQAVSFLYIFLPLPTYGRLSIFNRIRPRLKRVLWCFFSFRLYFPFSFSSLFFFFSFFFKSIFTPAVAPIPRRTNTDFLFI